MSYQTSFFRNLGRNRLHTFINLTGLSLSLAVVILLSAYLVGEWQVNRQIPEVDRLYLLVGSDQSALMPESLLASLKESVPGIKDATQWNETTDQVLFRDHQETERILSADSSFFSMFGLKLVAGSKGTFYSGQEMLVTTDLASLLTGEKSPSVDQVSAFNQYMPVGGILVSAGRQSGFRYDGMVPKSKNLYTNMHCWGRGDCESMYATAVLLEAAADPDTVQARVNALMARHSFLVNNAIQLLPFKKVYFDTSLKDDYMLHANISLIHLLLFITLAVLALAILNYVNLTSAMSLSRKREVGIRKIAGAGRRSIFYQFMGETYQITFLAVFLAVLITVFAKPFFEAILGKPVYLSVLYENMGTFLLVIGAILLLGGLMGFVPAKSTLRGTSLSLLSKHTPSTRGYLLKQSLIVLQFTVSIALVFSLLTVYHQVDYVKHKPVGFTTEQLIKVDLGYLPYEQAAALKEALQANPSIMHCSMTSGGPGNFINKTKFVESDQFGFSEYNYIRADTDFLRTFNIPLIKGTNLTGETGGMLINETVYKTVGGGNLDTFSYTSQKVCGVVGDFHWTDFHHSIGPVYIIPMFDSPTITAGCMNIRLNASNIPESLDFIKKTMASFGYQKFDYLFYDDYFNQLYQEEENQAKAIRLFTLLALLISGLGLFGLAEFSTRQKIKEIGIRRVNGATVKEILLHLNRNFLIPVLIAFVLACPIGWYVMHNWLQRFAYRADMSWWIFALAGLTALVVALLTVSWQSWRAATRNPVESLRYE